MNVKDLTVLHMALLLRVMAVFRIPSFVFVAICHFVVDAFGVEGQVLLGILASLHTFSHHQL